VKLDCKSPTFHTQAHFPLNDTNCIVRIGTIGESSKHERSTVVQLFSVSQHKSLFLKEYVLCKHRDWMDCICDFEWVSVRKIGWLWVHGILKMDLWRVIEAQIVHWASWETRDITFCGPPMVSDGDVPSVLTYTHGKAGEPLGHILRAPRRGAAQTIYPTNLYGDGSWYRSGIGIVAATRTFLSSNEQVAIHPAFRARHQLPRKKCWLEHRDVSVPLLMQF
jgi:hypothetical protein